ncbi:MAG TPA: efflux RND transporter permease subunit [Acidiferrobacterales bacterium]|nr:efflux RND transporter permease subunit [Acidiferrobacterales bacterium]
MIEKIIRWSIYNPFLVLMVTVLLTGWGIYAVTHTPLDAIPDLSDVQVIIKTSYPGQAPQVVEDQVTYPLTTTMMSVPGAKTVRGYSFFGDSYVYVLFQDGTDLYWARSRVLEYLNQAIGKLPPGVRPELGPDATGVGWVFEYALVDRSGNHDLSQLRSLQDWFLKYELRSVPGVAEVASLGGMVKQYQIVVFPDKLRAYALPLSKVIEAVKRANQETGGSVIELGEAEYMIRASGYLNSIESIQNIPVALGNRNTPVFIKDIARVQLGPELRRGIVELNGNGEVAGGVIVMRFGKNALEVIQAVKDKLASLQKGLPKGVEIVSTYDRSSLIHRAISTLTEKLIEESIIVALVCLAFLFHLRSAFVAIVALPIGILVAFIVMQLQGINANIMSLGGIAIAIGAMVDAAVVMIENAHKHLEAWRKQNVAQEPDARTRVEMMARAATEVGPALFFSLLIITVSFMPIFTLEAQEGRLFAPLAFTKTYAMAAAAGLSVTLIPVLMGYFIRGKIKDEGGNPLNRALIAGYQPLIRKVLANPRMTIGIALILLLLTAIPFFRLGSEFMPPLEEGDLLYMPTAQPGLSAGKVLEILQQTDRMIASFPEVERVFGKAGRAETATDPAPLEMFETTVQFKPKSQWRPGMTQEKLIAAMDASMKFPGFANVWVQPIRNRIDMLATGIKTPVGIKIAGPDIKIIETLGEQIERLVKTIPGTTSAFAERLVGGRYVDVNINRQAAARYGLNILGVQEVIATAIGGDNIGQTIEGLERYPINLRYPREMRDSVAALGALPIVTEQGATVPLSAVADIKIVDGPPMLRSENARPNGWIYVDIHGRDLGSYVVEAQKLVRERVQLPPGYSIAWSGQFEYLERAVKRMAVLVPLTLFIILLLLYFTFQRIAEAVLIMATLPFALIGGFWLLYLLGYNMSVAVAVGFIALAGVAAEFGVVMLIYLNQAIARYEKAGRLKTRQDLIQALTEGTVLRVRPIAMTVAVVIAGLLPIMLGGGTGSEVMQRIAAPMIGGMITAPLFSMLVVPAVYLLWKGRYLSNRSTLERQGGIRAKHRR